MPTGLRTKETPTQVFSCEICEIFKNTFFHRAHPVAASDNVTKNICLDYPELHLLVFWRNHLVASSELLIFALKAKRKTQEHKEADIAG